MENERFYSPNEISEKFNLKPNTVRKWINEGKLKAIKLGDIWRVSETSLQEFIKESMKQKLEL